MSNTTIYNDYTWNSMNGSSDISNIVTVGSGGGGTGGGGTVLTSGLGGSGLTWGQTTTTITNDYPALSVSGNAVIEGSILVKGKKLEDVIDKIEERLCVLHTNPQLEEKWSELRELRERYYQLEKEILEKEKTWSILNK